MTPEARSAGRRERKRAQLRAQIAAAAQQVVRAQGFDTTTIVDIADAADVSDRTFYRYFASKEAALLFPLRQFVDDFMAATERHLEGLDPLDAMLAAVDDLAGNGSYDDNLAVLAAGVAFFPSLAGEFYNQLMRGQDALTDVFARHLALPPGAHAARLLSAAGTMALTSAIAAWQVDDTLDVWELGRQGLRLATSGLGTLVGRDAPAEA